MNSFLTLNLDLNIIIWYTKSPGLIIHLEYKQISVRYIMTSYNFRY